MTISTVGSPLTSSLEMAESSPVAGAVMGQVLNQEKVTGQDAVDLIETAAAPSAGKGLSVYA
jgi:hypothetical protein